MAWKVIAAVYVIVGAYVALALAAALLRWFLARLREIPWVQRWLRR